MDRAIPLLPVSQMRYIIQASPIKRDAKMVAQTSMLHVRVDEKLKADATETLANFGLSISDAVRILLIRVVKEGGLPAGLTFDPETHDAWFTAKVREALTSSQRAVPHQQVMDESQALIDRKRRART